MKHVLKKAEPTEIELPNGETRRLLLRRELRLRDAMAFDDLDIANADGADKMEKTFAAYQIILPGLTREEFESLTTENFQQITELFAGPLVPTPTGNPAPSGDENSTSSG